MLNAYDYEAFGKTISQAGNAQDQYLFTGEQYEKSLNVYYLRDRFYNADSGRFMRRDTYEGEINNPITLHKYAYANANPLMFTDPSGKVSMIEGIIVHWYIGEDFRLQQANRLQNRGLNTILRARRAMGFPVTVPIPNGRKRPDLIDLDTQELYEIKTRRDAAKGANELADYINWITQGEAGWQEGTTYIPPSQMVLPVVGTIAIDSPGTA